MLLYINFIKIDRNLIHKKSTKDESKASSINSELNLNSVFKFHKIISINDKQIIKININLLIFILELYNLYKFYF